MREAMETLRSGMGALVWIVGGTKMSRFGTQMLLILEAVGMRVLALETLSLFHIILVAQFP
jgi:hypothetical protein